MNRWLGTLDTTELPPAALPPPVVGPHPCCAEYAIVTACDGQIDEWFCGVCHEWFTRPCPDAELLPIAAGGPR